MFKRLLVPLDGSHLAEAALPPAVFLAVNLHVPVVLLHVIEKNAPEAIHGERHLTDPDGARTYLAEIARKFFPPEVKVESHVHTSEVSNVPKSIVEHIAEFSPDLIIMCSHGEGGLRDFFYGSIAQQVIGRGDTPVLLIQPGESENLPSFALRKIIVPLDGNPQHEEGLPLAAQLAQACAARLHLLMVIPTLGTLKSQPAATGLFLPASMRAMLDLAEENAEDYLRSQASKLDLPPTSVTASVSRGDPATAIANVAKVAEADLILLSTHGKAGQDAFWSSSVAPKVSSLTDIPLLLVPV
jgi:nucleotide-binding universal stress UspA family protein